MAGQTKILALRNRLTGKVTKVNQIEDLRVRIGSSWIGDEDIGEGRRYTALVGRVRPGETPPEIR